MKTKKCAKTPKTKLENHYNEFANLIDGPEIAERIGISKIKGSCKNFKEWIEKLERLGEV